MHLWLFIILMCLICSSLTSGDVAFPCETPDDEHAYCVSLFLCPHLMKSLSTLDPGAIDYVKKSVCLGCEAGDVMVCCGSPKNFTEITTTSAKPPETVPPIVKVAVGVIDTDEDGQLKPCCKPSPQNVPYEPPKMDPASVARREYVKNNLLPSQRICGQQHTDDYVYERNETALDEFPWIVQLVLHGLDDLDYAYDNMCGGVLISNRYVLTDDYCGVEAFGQYASHRNVSCVQESSFVECTQPVVIRNVEKRILSSKEYYGDQYDIVLLKLNETVDFSDYIRPICLPINGSKRPTSENYLTFSGFGADHNNDIVKKRITYNVTDSQVCYDAEPQIHLKQKLKNYQASLACLKPPLGNIISSCYGDHGGPLMYKHKHKWFADAIMIEVVGNSDYRNPCSTTAPVSGSFITPTVMDWIYDKIES